ncbi:hypothetical protein BGZ88_001694 [Linnemannia elongata]|nr:hypothetical protein BGZ88_001694 [Linnemannia elongata]
MEGSTPSPPPTTKINPFHLPELMHRISRFVSLTDAIACAQVSKEWAETFIPIVWFEVDFSLQPRFADLLPDISSKHGQHIRIINNAKTIHEVTAVANEAVMNLTSLRIEAAASVMHHIRTYEIVSRSIPSLESLRLTAASESVNGEASLTHFVSASLNRLCTWQEHPQIAIPTAKIKEDVARFCPLLTRYELQGSRNLVHQFLAHIGRDVSSLMYKFSHIPGDTIMDILLHQATLQRLGVFSERSGASFDEDEVEEVSEVVQEFSQFFQLIPRGCSQLKHLDLHLLEMDMDEVELGEWACKDLVVLRVRIKGLDTKERILEAIALWRQGCWKRRQEEAGAPITLEEERDDQMDLSIEARVAHHLLKLEKLRSVWLGCQTCGPI